MNSQTSLLNNEIYDKIMYLELKDFYLMYMEFHMGIKTKYNTLKYTST